MTVSVIYKPTGDDELDVISICAGAIQNLRDQESRIRVIEYIRQRYGHQIDVADSAERGWIPTTSDMEK